MPRNKSLSENRFWAKFIRSINLAQNLIFKIGPPVFWFRLAGTLLALILLVLLLRDQSWPEISSAINRVGPGRLAATLALTLLSRVAVAMRWHVLLHSAQEPVDLGMSLRLTFAGLFASNFLPTTIGGDVVRLAGSVQMRINAAVSTASLVADRLIGMAGMMLALPWGLARLTQVGLPALLAHNESGLASSGALGWVGGWWKRGTTFARQTLANFGLWSRRPGALGLSFAFTCLHMACLFTSIVLLLDGMGEPLAWIQVAGIWSLVYFITLLPISVNGYGLQEISTTLLYARLGGISTEASVAVAILLRILQMFASLPGAAFIPSILARRDGGTPGQPVN
jgi:uncharacterized membrane protein YbhN (UPF0104 family)